MMRMQCSEARQELAGHPRLRQQQQCCRPVLQRHRLAVLCRYDLRKSANNAEQRKQRQLLPGTSAAERSLTQEQLKEANATLVHQRAYTLCGASKGQLSHHLCLFLLTEQPSLMQINSGLLASRIATMADVLGLTQPDTAELLVRNGALLDVLPLRLKSTAEALSLALGLSPQAALVMLASDLTLLDTPPLRLKHRLQALAELLQVQFDVLADMAAACPHVMKVEPAAVQIRWTNIMSLLHDQQHGRELNSSDLQYLLQQEPRLLMPSSETLTQNHTAICQALGLKPECLNCWVFVAPKVLLVPAAQLQKRIDALLSVLSYAVNRLGIPDAAAADGYTEDVTSSNQLAAAAAAAADDEDDVVDDEYDEYDNKATTLESLVSPGGERAGRINNSSSSGRDWVSVISDAEQITAYISKDPRVLLVPPHEIQARLASLRQELCCSSEVLSWLTLTHPSYLAVEPGSVTSWMCDVRHLTQMSAQQAIRLALCPQVFLTMSPEEVYLSITSLCNALQLQHPAALAVIAHEPLLLQQNPSSTTAALQQLTHLIPERSLCQQLLIAVPELLLQGQQLPRAMASAAALLSLSCTQLAVALIREPSLWWVVAPRATWACSLHCTQQQQQQRRLLQVPQQAVPQQQQQHNTLQQQQPLSPAAAAAVEAMSALVNSGLRSPAVMQQVAVLQPLLLRLGAEAVQLHVEQLLVVCEGCHQWQQQLQGMPPELLGKCILKIMVWKSRLMFLQETGLAARVPLQEVICMSRGEFERCFAAEYKAWKAARKTQQHWVLLQQLQQSEQQGWQRRPQQQLRLGCEPDPTQLHMHDLVTALEAFAAGHANGSSSGSSSSSTQAVLRRSDSGVFGNARRPAQVSGASSNMEVAVCDSLANDHICLQQQQVTLLHNQAAEGEVFYLNDGAPQQWDTEQLSSCKHGSSVSESGGTENSSHNWRSTQRQQQQQQHRQAWQQQFDLQQQQQQQQERARQLPTLLHEPFIKKIDMQLMAVQQSALELYGSWNGSLVQPAAAPHAEGPSE